MKESIVMTDLRKIKEELSLKHWSMTQDEINAELKKADEWFYETLGREKPREIKNSEAGAAKIYF